MTTTVKVHVNGNYQATVTQTSATGETQSKVGPNEEKAFYLPHPAESTFHIVEEYLGDKPGE